MIDGSEKRICRLSFELYSPHVIERRRKTCLSARVFEARTATGREHFACQDRIVSHIFILLISNGEKILSNVNVVV